MRAPDEAHRRDQVLDALVAADLAQEADHRLVAGDPERLADVRAVGAGERGRVHAGRDHVQPPLRDAHRRDVVALVGRVGAVRVGRPDREPDRPAVVAPAIVGVQRAEQRHRDAAGPAGGHGERACAAAGTRSRRSRPPARAARRRRCRGASGPSYSVRSSPLPGTWKRCASAWARRSRGARRGSAGCRRTSTPPRRSSPGSHRGSPGLAERLRSCRRSS